MTQLKGKNLEALLKDVPSNLVIRNPDSNILQLYELNTPFMIILETCHEQKDFISMYQITHECCYSSHFPFTGNRSLLKRPLHQHSCFEIMYVLSGSVTNHVENQTFTYGPGQCCVMNKNIKHCEDFAGDFQVVFFMFQSSFRKKERKDMGKGTESYHRLIRILLLTSFPVILIALVTQGSVIADQIMFLKMSSKSQDTIVQWGVYAGKYRILSGMPIIVVTSICASLVPAMSVSNASMNIGRLKEKAQLLLRLALMLALPAAAFFAIMADTLMPALFKTGNLELPAALLRIGSIAIIFQALSMAMAGILQGLERERNVLINSAIAFLVHIITLYILLKSTKLGITAVLISTIVLYALLFILNLLSVQRRISLRIDWGRMIGTPVISAAVSGVIILLINKLLTEKMGSMAMTILCLILGTIIYLVLLLALHGITERDLKDIPAGEILITAARALHLM